MADLTDEAIARAEQTIKAGPVFAANAEVIAARTPDLPPEHTLVAVVNTDFEFTGTHVVSRAALVDIVPGLEGDGWAMVFSHKSDAEQIRYRAGEMVSIAQKRIEMIRRLRAKADSGSIPPPSNASDLTTGTMSACAKSRRRPAKPGPFGVDGGCSSPARDTEQRR